MTHPGVYVVTIGLAIGAALFAYFMSDRQHYEATPTTYRNFDSHNEGPKCTICLDNVSSFDKESLPCGHGFHQRCIKKWVENNSSCPNCRVPCRMP